MNDWALLAISILAFSGIPGLLGSRDGRRGQMLSTILMLVGGSIGLVEAFGCLIDGQTRSLESAWFLPWGQFAVRMDSLSAVFLIPVFLIPTLGALYGQSYWRQSEHPANGRKLRFFYGLLAASMAMVVLSRDAVLFLIVWEMMALSAYFLATADDEDEAACKAGWVYLIATHLGTLCLIAMAALLRHVTGSFSLDAIRPDALSPAAATALFLLAVIGFGFKAGLIPLHVWLPGAHANAPSHVSAVMSGVMLKMGVYGIVRMTSLFPNPPAWWGQMLLAVGAISGVVGIAFALGQSDLKRTLAYSSIENIGIIVMGIGLALIGRALGRSDWIALGLGGSLLHVLNHGLFKSLLFLNAGCVIHAAQTREIERLGGLAKRMPRTAFLFTAGALAICALPPLNGFVSELLIYLGLFRTMGIGTGSVGPTWPFAALAAPVLAVIGALAVACFVNLLGTIFLGQPRSEASHHAHDPSLAMIAPMSVLAAGCLAVGVASASLAPALDRAVQIWKPGTDASLFTLAPLLSVTWMAAGLIGVAVILVLVLRAVVARSSAGTAGTWDCGYARPSTRMEYSGSSFNQVLVGLFGWVLFPKKHRPQVSGIFPAPANFKIQVPDTVLDRLVIPFYRFAGRTLPWFRFLQQGRIQIYVLYFVVILIVLYLWGSNGR
jgi:hydrogenase-4 component B